jgi:PKD repeat protein
VIGTDPPRDVVATGGGGIRLYTVDVPTRSLLPITDGTGTIPGEGEGFCLYARTGTAELFAFNVTRAGRVRQYAVDDVDHDGLLHGHVVREWQMGSETEGCVVDDVSGALYLAEEDVALWRYDADPEADLGRVAVDTVFSTGGRLAPDIEGIALVDGPTGGRVIVSAQNISDRSSSYFNVYDRTPSNGFIQAFRIGDGAGADDCDGTDGVAAYAGNLGPAFPNGLLVCQDNSNEPPGTVGNQNFKYANLGLALSPPANVPPSADFSVECVALVCEFDGSLSDDPDGLVVSHGWGFGDGGSGSEVLVSHEYEFAGSYQVALTVVDDQGASDVVSRLVTVSEAAAEVSFVGSSAAAVSSGTSATAPVPAGVQVGDRLLLFGSVPVTSPVATAPAGWSLVGSRVAGPLATYVWSRTATAADLGGSVLVSMGQTTTKLAVAVAAYRGADLGVFASQAEGAGSVHVTPVVSATAGAWVVSYWSDKSSGTTAWTAPGSVVTRQVTLTTGGGRVTSLLADSAGPRPAGSAGGLTATTNASSGRAATWTLLLNPQP